MTGSGFCGTATTGTGTTGMTGTASIGGWQGGLFYDLCGSYGPSFANASLSGVANLLVLALLYSVTVRTPRLAARAAA